ncbi:hypothetical protein ES332_D12G046900v1 [Gossypium tomentosum]|uniref:Uncharacterized protein n=1 Tax=Gossypium tomentosum TaxID=34277 RepID=A0A5D2I5M2_GOSTO|nr:hypothetical protein ES332_D12G046900v1 [Gossypium tomentosum]
MILGHWFWASVVWFGPHRPICILSLLPGPKSSITPLISRTKVDGRIKRVEYESLPNVCFACGFHGHMKDMCSFSSGQERQKGEELVLVMDQGILDTTNNGVENEKYGPWMLVDRQSKRNSRKQSDDRQDKKKGRFIGIQS